MKVRKNTTKVIKPTSLRLLSRDIEGSLTGGCLKPIIDESIAKINHPNQPNPNQLNRPRNIRKKKTIFEILTWRSPKTA